MKRLKAISGRRAVPIIFAVIAVGAAGWAGAQARTADGIDQPAQGNQPATRLAVPTRSSPSGSVPAAPSGGFPTAASAGVPAGWTPTRSITGNYTVDRAGAVVEDLRITNGSLIVNAPNVTLRRVEVRGGSIDNGVGSSCGNGLLIENSTVMRAPGQVTREDDLAIGTGGYTARNVKIDGLPEGFRVGGKSMGCGQVVIENSWARVVSPDVCGDWHGDGLQGYDGARVTIRNSYLELVERDDCGGTAPFFYPADQGNTSVDIDGLIVKGGGASVPRRHAGNSSEPEDRE